MTEDDSVPPSAVPLPPAPAAPRSGPSAGDAGPGIALCAAVFLLVGAGSPARAGAPAGVAPGPDPTPDATPAGAVPAPVSGASARGPAAPGPAAAPDSSDPRAVMDSLRRRWAALMERRDSLPREQTAQRAEALVRDAFALESVAASVLPDRWSDLRPRRRRELVEALASAVRSDVMGYLEDSGPAGLSPLEPTDERTEDGARVLEYRPGEGGEGSDRLAVHLRRTGPDGWAIHDVAYGGTRMVEHYRKRARKLVDEYSVPYMIGVLGNRRTIVFENFEDDPVGELPGGWKWRDRDDDARKPYEVREEDGNRYLAARDEGSSVSLGKDRKWNLEEYPYLSFRIRVHRIPEGGDERYGKTVDSAAGIYVVYRRKAFGLIPESVKFVWSSTLPVGAATQRQGVGKPWQVVVGSGREGLGEWHRFVFDLREAYRDTFRGDPPDKPLGLAILSDANATHSQAYADYDDFELHRSVPGDPGSGVEEILRP